MCKNQSFKQASSVITYTELPKKSHTSIFYCITSTLLLCQEKKRQYKSIDEKVRPEDDCTMFLIKSHCWIWTLWSEAAPDHNTASKDQILLAWWVSHNLTLSFHASVSHIWWGSSTIFGAKFCPQLIKICKVFKSHWQINMSWWVLIF